MGSSRDFDRLVERYAGARLAHQFRAVARDFGDETPDYGRVVDSREEAEAELARMLAASPSYDEGFIEWRLVSEWGRLD